MKDFDAFKGWGEGLLPGVVKDIRLKSNAKDPVVKVVISQRTAEVLGIKNRIIFGTIEKVRKVLLGIHQMILAKQNVESYA